MESHMAHLKLVLSGPGRGEVFLDGKKIENVTGVNVSACVGKMNQVTITVSCHQVDVEGEVDAKVVGP